MHKIIMKVLEGKLNEKEKTDDRNVQTDARRFKLLKHFKNFLNDTS